MSEVKDRLIDLAYKLARLGRNVDARDISKEKYEEIYKFTDSVEGMLTNLKIKIKEELE